MIIIEDNNILCEEPRIGFVPVNSNKTIEVYIVRENIKNLKAIL